MSNIVYKYTCELCKEFYVGKKCRQFRNRIRELQGLTVRTGKLCAEGCEVFSEIRSHCHGHQVHANPENFEIIAKLRNESHLERLESLYQRTLKPKIINQCPSVPLITFSNSFFVVFYYPRFGYCLFNNDP